MPLVGEDIKDLTVMSHPPAAPPTDPAIISATVSYQRVAGAISARHGLPPKWCWCPFPSPHAAGLLRGSPTRARCCEWHVLRSPVNTIRCAT